MNLERHTQKANEIFNEIASELGDEKNRDRAARILRAVLHSLRKRLPLEESMQFISQLPMYLKAMYVDGWKISKAHKEIKHLDEFMEDVYLEADGYSEFPDANSVYDTVLKVIIVLKRHISDGELNDIKSTMPKELKFLWETEDSNYENACQ